MRRNMNALSVELYCALSNWNDNTENEVGERILTEEQVGEMAQSAMNAIEASLHEEGLI